MSVILASPSGAGTPRGRDGAAVAAGGVESRRASARPRAVVDNRPVRAGSTISPAVRCAALFPHDDLPDPPPGHPYRVIRRPGYVIGTFPGGTFGTVSVTAIEPDALEGAVEEVRTALAAEGAGRAVWFVPGDSPPTLEAMLACGMAPCNEPPFEPSFTAMALVTPPEPGPPDVEARLATSFEEFVEARRIAEDAFDMSEADREAFEAKSRAMWEFELDDGAYRTYVALIEGEVIGCAASIGGANATYLAGGGTRADRRGRGAYRSLVRARWDTAVERGTPALTVGAGAMSGPILERLGFERIGRIECLLDRFE